MVVRDELGYSYPLNPNDDFICPKGSLSRGFAYKKTLFEPLPLTDDKKKNAKKPQSQSQEGALIS